METLVTRPTTPSVPAPIRGSVWLRRLLRLQGVPARLGPRLRAPFLFALRLLAGGHFLLDGVVRFGALGEWARRYAALGIPLAGVYAFIAAAVALLGGLGLLLGRHTARASVALLFLLLLVLLAQEPQVLRELLRGRVGPLADSAHFAPLAMTWLLWLFGPGPWSLDERHRAPRMQ